MLGVSHWSGHGIQRNQEQPVEVNSGRGYGGMKGVGCLRLVHREDHEYWVTLWWLGVDRNRIRTRISYHSSVTAGFRGFPQAFSKRGVMGNGTISFSVRQILAEELQRLSSQPPNPQHGFTRLLFCPEHSAVCNLCAELVDMELLSKVNAETHMQIVEQMKLALK